MEKTRLGNTDAMVSKMCLGCLGFGNKNDEATSYELLDYYYEQGGNFLDTSNNYSFFIEGFKGGESETTLGKWMKDRKNRQDIFLATKVGALPTDREKLLANSSSVEAWQTYTEGLSKKAIFKAVDDSLKRLQTDYIDLYYAHIDHRTSDLEETIEAFDELVKSGKVKYIGCSNYLPWRLERAINISKRNSMAAYSALQVFFTYLQPKTDADYGIAVFADSEVQDYCRENPNVSLLAYTPTLWGMYTNIERRKECAFEWNKYDTPENKIRLNALEKVASETGATINQVLYAWLLHRTPKTIPLVAVSKIAHLKENLGSMNVKLTREQMDFLNNPFI